MLQHLMEDNKVGKLKKELESSGYKECFQELSIQEGVIMRGEIMVIPKTLRPDVLQGKYDKAAQIVLVVAKIYHRHQRV